MLKSRPDKIGKDKLVLLDNVIDFADWINNYSVEISEH